MQIKREKYNLGQSTIVKITESELDLKLDVKLTNNTSKTNIGAKISGVVKDLNNIPIAGAIVKLMSSDFKPLTHVTTDNNGIYFINIVSYSSSYNIEVTFPGKLVAQASTFSLLSGENKNINFIMYNDPNANLGVISGELYDNINSKAIAGAVIFLYNINDGNKLIAITYTDNTGAFIFTELPISNYSIRLSALGYIPLQVLTNVQSGHITMLKKFLNINPNASNGIVSGIVTNDFNNPVIKADVILYSVDKNNMLTPVAFNTTNSLGIYTFINVPIGNYIVKSNQSQLVDLNSTSTIPSNTLRTTNPLTNTMFNFLGDSNNLKVTIGFDTNNKKLIVNSTDEIVNINWGNTLYFNIILYDNNSVKMKEVSINGNENSYKVYSILNGLNFDYGYYFKIVHKESELKLNLLGSVINGSSSLSLGFGNIDLNKVYFYITPLGIQYSNRLIPISNIQMQIPTTTNLAQGLIQNGAKVISTGAVTNIGGVLNGSVIINYIAQNTGRYSLSITVLGANKPLAIDINGINTGINYNINNFNVASINFNTTVVTVTIPLNKGNNTIKFHGDGKNIGPDLFTVNFKPILLTLPKGTYNLADGFLTGGAKLNIDGNKVIYIGGPSDGTSTINVNVESTAKYNIGINYYNGGREFELEINNISTGTIYKTPSLANGLFTLPQPINLNMGNNIIKFKGNRISYAPELGEFSVGLISGIVNPPTVPTGSNPVYKYNAAEGMLSNGALIEDAGGVNVAGWIGGPSDGATTLTVNVAAAGNYNLAVKYIGADANRNLKIDINGTSTGSVYTPTPTNGWSIGDAKTFTVAVNLNSGTNTIKFHGDGINYGPSLGEVTLTLISTIETIMKTYNYNVVNGLLENGARIDEIANLATYIGGPTNGASTIAVNVSNDGVYNLIINYRNNNRPLKIDVNGINTGTIYNITGDYSGSFNLPITLQSGLNKLKFYGDGINYAPDLGVFTLIEISSKYNFNTVDGILSNGALIEDAGGVNVVGWIGGPSDGATTLTVNVESAGSYNLAVQYIGADANRNLKIDINGTSTGLVYTPTPTDGWIIGNSKIFSITVNLNSGSNTIKFHGDGTNYGPSLGQVTLSLISTTSITIPNTIESKAIYKYNAIDGVLSNGALIEDAGGVNVAGWIGGPSDGSTTLTVNVENGGKYNLVVQYIGAESNRNLKIDINGVNTGSVYTPTPTDGWTIENVKTFTVAVNLNNGINTIKFHGDGINYGPSLGEVILSLPITTQTIIPASVNVLNFEPLMYTVSHGKLNNGAKLDLSNFVINLGGVKGGSSILTIDVPINGLYHFILTVRNTDSFIKNLKLEINDVELDTNYVIANTLLSTLSSKINLKSGNNKIKFYGDGNNKAPDLGAFTLYYLKEGNESPEVLFPITYNVTMGVLGGKAIINKEIFSGYVTNLVSGNPPSYVTMIAYIPKNGEYTIVINYINSKKTESLKVLQISINGVHIEKRVYPIETSNQGIIKVNVNFNKGINTITFSANLDSDCPDIGDFTIDYLHIN